MSTTRFFEIWESMNNESSLMRHYFIFDSKSLIVACFCTRGDRFVLQRALLASIATSKARFGHLHFADEPSHLRIFLCSRVEKANQLHIFMNWLSCEASSLKLYLSWPISTHVSQPLRFLPQIQRFLRCRRPWRLMGLFVTTSLLFTKKQNLQKTLLKLLSHSAVKRW